MLQIAFIRDNRDVVIAGLKKRNFPDAEAKVDKILEVDKYARGSRSTLEAKQAEHKKYSDAYGKLMREGRKEEAEYLTKPFPPGILGQYLGIAEQTEKDLRNLILDLPNLPHSSVPEGRSADDNEVVLEWGDKPTLHAKAQPHWELIKRFGPNGGPMIDFELGVKISGAGFPVYKGKAARLQRALINFFLDEALAAGYSEVQPPIVINEASGFGTGQLPDKEGQMYYATADELYLIPTAEVPITNLYRDVLVNEAELPIQHVGYTPCFRREAGSWGAHVRGLNRLHQFDKVEIVRIERPENSYAVLEQMSLYVQGLLQKLELPYRVLRLCGGDMGFTSALTYDMEVWSAAQERWLEVSSVSNFETYQANRLKLRAKLDGNKPTLLHTLNGSALALPRIVASILENNQTDPSDRPAGIRIPAVLVPYCGFDMIS
jgi:seryl-tRNA synthetase